MTAELTIHAKHHTYPVVISPGIRHEVGQWLERLHRKNTDDVFIVTDETVEAIGYLRDVVSSLTGRGFTVHHFTIPPGDASKSMEVALQLYNALLDAGVRRSGIVAALGGGVVGDLTGFVAATYLRGVAFLQIPTTLLAHDSSIGGKVGINLNRGKNLVGAFYPPIAVLYDTQVLSSLPGNQWQSGMAEVIKHAVIADAQLFSLLEQEPLRQIPAEATLEPVLARAMAVKKVVIEADETERLGRMVLNLGHSVGHAIEQYSHYQISHGEAVAIGMVVEGRIAVTRGLLSHDDWLRIRAVLAAHGLPTAAPTYPYVALKDILRLDKKNSADALTMVLPKGIGEVSIYRDIVDEEVERAYAETAKELVE